MNILNWLKFNFKKISKHKHPLVFFLHLLKSKVIFLIGDHMQWSLALPIFKYRRNKYFLHYAPNQFSKVLYTYPDIVRHPDDEVFLSTYLKEGDTYIDVGANIGTTTLAAAMAVGETGYVVSYEAHPVTFSYLVRSAMDNTKMLSRVILRNVALASAPGKVDFTSFDGHDDINHVLSLKNASSVSVSAVRLDDENLPKHIDLIKIDVEGYELEVFKGALEILKNTDAIFFEIFDDNSKIFDYESKEVLILLSKLNFKIYKIDIQNKYLTMVQIERYIGSKQCENMVAARDEADLLQRTGFTVS